MTSATPPSATPPPTFTAPSLEPLQRPPFPFSLVGETLFGTEGDPLQRYQQNAEFLRQLFTFAEASTDTRTQHVSRTQEEKTLTVQPAEQEREAVQSTQQSSELNDDIMSDDDEDEDKEEDQPVSLPIPTEQELLEQLRVLQASNHRSAESHEQLMAKLYQQTQSYQSVLHILDVIKERHKQWQQLSATSPVPVTAAAQAELNTLLQRADALYTERHGSALPPTTLPPVSDLPAPIRSLPPTTALSSTSRESLNTYHQRLLRSGLPAESATQFARYYEHVLIVQQAEDWIKKERDKDAISDQKEKEKRTVAKPASAIINVQQLPFSAQQQASLLRL